MNKLTVNGKTYNVQGRNIVIDGGYIKVGGDVIESNLKGDVNVKFEGDVADIKCDNIEVYGNVNGNVNCIDLKCDDIKGDVDSVNVMCDDIKGNVKSNNVSCDCIEGDVECTSMNCDRHSGSANIKS